MHKNEATQGNITV